MIGATADLKLEQKADNYAFTNLKVFGRGGVRKDATF